MDDIRASLQAKYNERGRDLPVSVTKRALEAYERLSLVWKLVSPPGFLEG